MASDDDKIGEYHQVPRPLTPKNTPQPDRYGPPRPVTPLKVDTLEAEDVKLISEMIRMRMTGAISDDAYKDFLKSLRSTSLAKKKSSE